MIMRLLFTFVLLLFCCYTTFAQETTGASNRNQAVYLELAGNGLVFSLNYDMRLAKNRQDGHGVRIGVGGFPVYSRDNAGNRVKGIAVTIPLAYNYLIGKRRSAFELGAGITPAIGYVEGVEISGEEIKETDFALLGFANVGYRYQPLNSGFVFRFTWTPAVTNEGFQPFWLGLSLGYGFK